MEPDKIQEQSAGDAEAPTKDNGPAQKEPTDTTNYEQAGSGGVSPVILILLVLLAIGIASKFLIPAATGIKPNESETKKRGAFAPYVQGSPSQPAN
jgi:hypothetical protein